MKFPTALEHSTRELQRIALLSELNHSEFVTDIELLNQYRRSMRRTEKFYSQPLALWMFVPCGEDGEPLEYPHYYSQFVKGHLGAGYNPNRMEDTEWCDECKAYQIAQQRILFKGFQFCGGNTVQCSEFSLNIEEYNSIDAFVNSCRGSFTVTPTQSAKTILNLPE